MGVGIGHSSATDHTLQLSNLSMQCMGWTLLAYIVRFDSYKHLEPELAPCTIGICLVKAMYDYLQIRIPSSSVLFCKCRGSVTREWFASLVKNACGLAGLDLSKYNTHSFRVGRCTDWVEQGLTVTQIRSKGRWKSFSFLCYVRAEAIRF